MLNKATNSTCNTPAKTATEILDDLYSLVPDLSKQRKVAEEAVRALFTKLGEDFDEGYCLVLPVSYQAVVERLHGLPYITEDLKRRVMLDTHNMLPNGQAVAVHLSALTNSVSWGLESQINRDLYNGN